MFKFNKINKKIINVVICNDFCMQSYPCQHYCTIYYDDNTKEQVRLSAVVIYSKYRDFVDESNLNHYKNQYDAIQKQKEHNKMLKKFYRPSLKYRIKRFFSNCFN